MKNDAQIEQDLIKQFARSTFYLFAFFKNNCHKIDLLLQCCDSMLFAFISFNILSIKQKKILKTRVGLDFFTIKNRILKLGCRAE